MVKILKKRERVAAAQDALQQAGVAPSVNEAAPDVQEAPALMLQEISIKEPTPAIAYPERLGSQCASKTVDLRVERICPNPTWVLARHGTVMVQVRVKNNRAMARGTLLKECTVLKKGAYQFHGRVRA